MSLRNRIQELQTPEEVDQFLQKHPTGAIFKAGSCHKTTQGFHVVEEVLSAFPDLPVGFVRVVQWRPASNHIAEQMGVTHQSPQLILYVDGKRVFDVDNWAITPATVEQAMDTFLKHHRKETNGVSVEKNLSALHPYRRLLEQLLADQLSEENFRFQWLKTLQLDAEFHSATEYALLNSLYGEVDKALATGYSVPVRERAENLFQKLFH